MTSRPLVVHVNSEPSLFEITRAMLGDLPVDYVPGRSAQDISDKIPHATLLIVNLPNISIVQNAKAHGYKGRAVLYTGDTSLRYSAYRELGVDEILFKTLGSVEEFRGTVLKHTSEVPRVLHACRSQALAALRTDQLSLLGCSTIGAMAPSEVFPNAYSAHLALVEDMPDGEQAITKIRERYDSNQLPILWIVERDFTRKPGLEDQAIIWHADRGPATLELFINSYKAQHLKRPDAA